MDRDSLCSSSSSTSILWSLLLSTLLLHHVLVPLLGAREREALLGRLPLGHHGEEGVVALLDVELQQVRQGEALPAHRAAVAVDSVVVKLGLDELREGLGAAGRLAAEHLVVGVEELLDVVQGEEGGGSYAGLSVPLC